MIKQLRYLCTLLLMAVASVAWGEEVTFSPSEFVAVSSQEFTHEKSGITISCSNGTITSTQFRIFKSQTLKISSSEQIEKIVITCTASGTAQYGPGCFAAIDGYSYNGEIGTWTGSAQEVTFTASSNQVRATSIVVTYSSASTNQVATPSISGTTPFYASTEVAITCGTDGASIQYSTDGTTWSDYSEPFTISETTTVQAKATKEGLTESEIASKTFTKGTVMTVAEARAAIDAGTGTTGVFVKGIISQIDDIDTGDYGNATYWISDDGTTTDQFEVYRGYSLNGKKFTSADEIKIADEVVVYGNIKKYGSTYEFDSGSKIVSITHSELTDPALAFATTEFTVSVGDAFTAPELTNNHAVTVSYASSNENVAEVNATTGAVTLKGVAGAAIITASFAGDATYKPSTASYTIHVADTDKGTSSRPYTVAEAMAFIENLGGATSQTVYVSGIVSQVDSYNNNTITYWISDDGTTATQMQVYSGKGLESADFSSKDDLKIGDEVTVCGNVKLYNETPEFDKNNYLVAFNRPETPVVLPVPTFSPAAGAVDEGTVVTISVADEENVVDYLQFSYDQENWAEYTDETVITIAQDTTIYARSVGTTPNTYSEVASATYTIKAEPSAEDVVIVDEDKTTFLFNTEGNEWKFPTTKTVDEGTFFANGYSIKVAGSTGNGYSYNTSDKYLLIGKQGAYLTLPAFDFEVGKIEVVGRSGASGKVTQNIFVNVEGEEIAVSTETTGITGTQSYVIGGDYRAAGNVYTLKVTNGNNTQITQIVVYKATGEEKADPQLKFSDTSATATLGSEFAAPTLSYVDGFDGSVIYESSNPSVATIDEDGNVTIVAAGETVIKATSEETDNYLAGEAIYTLTVQEAPVVGSDKYELVTDASLLKAGDDVVFAFVGTLTVSSAETKVAQAMGTEFGNNSVLLAVDVVDNGDKTISTGDNVMFLTLRGEENAWTFENNDGKYLTSTGKKKNEDGNTPSSNQNTIELTEDGTDAHTQAHITIAEDGEATVTFNGGNGCNLLQYNVNNGKNQRFSCYSSKLSGLQIYRKVSSTEAEKGDVNKDGDVTIADVTALVNIILGKTTDYDERLADVDDANGITIADVTALVNIILGKTN